MATGNIAVTAFRWLLVLVIILCFLTFFWAAFGDTCLYWYVPPANPVVAGAVCCAGGIAKGLCARSANCAHKPAKCCRYNDTPWSGTEPAWQLHYHAMEDRYSEAGATVTAPLYGSDAVGVSHAAYGNFQYCCVARFCCDKTAGLRAEGLLY